MFLTPTFAVFRQPRQELADQVRGASRRRPPHPAVDPEMAQRWGDGGRRMVEHEDRESARFGDFTASREHLPALCFRSMGERLAHEMGARRSGSRPLRGRHHLRIPTPSRGRSFSGKTFGNDWESLDWNYTLTRRAGLSSGGLPNKTGNEEEKASPRRSPS